MGRNDNPPNECYKKEFYNPPTPPPFPTNGCCPPEFPYLSANKVYCFNNINAALKNNGYCKEWCGVTPAATTACGRDKQPCRTGTSSRCCPKAYPFLSQNKVYCFNDINAAARNNGVCSQWCGYTNAATTAC